MKSGAQITTVGGDGPASFKKYGASVLGDIDAFAEQGLVVFFSGGGVPLKAATEGESKLPMVLAMRQANVQSLLQG